MFGVANVPNIWHLAHLPHLLWMLLYEIPLWEKPIPPILIHCDSTAAIGRIKNRYYNGKSIPIRRKHSTIRSYLSDGIITVDYIKSNNNLANPFTKALAKDRVWNT